MARIEYEAGLYINKQREIIIPSRVLEANLCEGARVQKEGKIALAGLFVDTDATFTYEGGPMSVEELLNSPDHRLTVPVSVNMSKIMRTRPMFRNWTAFFKLSIDSQRVNENQIRNWLENGGAAKGLGDWRPRYGRYLIQSFKEI